MKWAEIWSRFSPRRIVIYADFIDPFCYIGFHNVRRVTEAEDIPLIWRGFELNPETPVEGALLEQASNSDLRPGMWASVNEFAKKSGLVLTEQIHVSNTWLAQDWVQTIQNRDVKNSLIERIYEAYLSNKMDIGDSRVLTGLANEFGLPAGPIHDLGASRDQRELEKFRQEALAYQFPGMPAFLYRGKTYFGALSEQAWRDIVC